MVVTAKIADAVLFRWKLALTTFVVSSLAIFLLSSQVHLRTQSRSSPPVTAVPSDLPPPGTVQAAVTSSTLPQAAPATSGTSATETATTATPPLAVGGSDPGQAHVDAALRLLHVSLQKDMEQRENLRRQQGTAQAISPAAPPARPATPQPDQIIIRENPGEEAARRQVAAARSALQGLQERYTDLHPDVVAAREELEAAQAHLAQLVASRPPPERRHVAAIPSPEVDRPAGRPANDFAASIQVLDRTIASEVAEIARLEAYQRTRKASSRSSQVVAAQPSPVQGAPVQTQPTPVQVAPAQVAPAQAAPAQAAPAPPTASASVPDAAPPSADLSSAERPTSPPLPIPLATRILWSIALGLLTSGAVTFLAEKLDRSIKDATALQAALPDGILYLGAIPRMRRG